MSTAQVKLTPEEIVTLALNEQGYLFHHKVIQVLNPPGRGNGTSHRWEIEACEVPVSLPNGAETRIDIVLQHGPDSGVPWRVAVECKRSSRDYKRWVFFAATQYQRGPSPGLYYTEQVDLRSGRRGDEEPDWSHGLQTTAAQVICPVFDFGVEARTEPPDRQKRASATDAIEEAFRQVTLGQAGLAHKLKRAHALQFRLIPVVVTTAELMSAEFDGHKVSLERDELDAKNLKLEPRKWLAVNYRISDVVSQLSGFTVNRTASIADGLAARQVRTVFVVQAEHIQPFLAWLEKYFPHGGR